MALLHKDDLRGMVHRLVPRTASRQAPQDDKKKAAELHMHAMAKEMLKKMNSGQGQGKM